MTLRAKLFLLLTLPMAGVAFFGIEGAWGKWAAKRNYEQLATASTVLRQFGAVVHELQKERGRSAVYLGSQGVKFSKELPEQQRATDGEIGKLNELLKSFDVERFDGGFKGKFRAGMDALGELYGKRTVIQTLGMPGAESTAYFTRTIGCLLDVGVAVTHSVSDAEIAKGMAAYVNFLQAKEQNGIERAVMATVFSNDKFAGDAFSRFNKAVAAQDTFMRVFSGFATETQLKLLAAKVQGESVNAVATMRQTAIDKAAEGKFGVPSNVWFDAITAKMDLMKEVEDKLAEDYLVLAGSARKEAGRAFVVFSVATGLIVAVTLLMGLTTIRSVTGPLGIVITGLTGSSNQVAATSTEISAASRSLAEGASEQAASLEETSASLEEMSSMTKKNAEHAEAAKVLAGQTRAAADAGVAEMNAMNEAMGDIQSAADNIAKILKTIDEIAFQTNILALNAAVEAARAGEAGMGFAVVADEVRNLAQRSARAARETAEKIEDSIGKSTRGVEISRQVSARLTEIVEKARQVNELVAEIATASLEQSQGIGQINMAITEVDKVTQRTAASAEETASAAQELNVQAYSLKDAVADLSAVVEGAEKRKGSSRAAAMAGKPADRANGKPVNGRGAMNGLGRRNGHGREAFATVR